MANIDLFFQYCSFEHLASKLDEVKGVISKYEVHSFCLTVTYIYKEEKDNVHEIPG